MQELCNSNSWIIEKTFYQKKNIHFILISILYWIESKFEYIELSELKWDEDKLILKSQEVQRQTYADILNIEQSAKNIKFNKRNRNFSLQEIVRSRNWAFSKNSNRICYDSSYASMLIAMLMTMLMTMFMTVVDRSSLDYWIVSKSTLFRVNLCFSESYK